MAMQFTLRNIKHILILTILVENPFLEAQAAFRSKRDLVTRPALSRSPGHPGDRGTELASELVARTVNDYLSSCHLVLMTSRRSDLLESLLRKAESIVENPHPRRGLRMGTVAVQVESAMAAAPSSRTALLQGLWGAADVSCRAIVVDLMDGNDRSVFRFLEAGLSERPKIRVLMLGPEKGAASSLLHPALKNSISAVYFSVVGTNSSWIEVVRRCLYCRGGEAGVEPLGPWHSREAMPTEEALFPDEFRNFYGHRFRVVTLRYFPFIEYTRESDAPGSKVSPRDCLDLRILSSLASRNNFTFEIREPLDGEWGVPRADTGNWSGSVGTLQHDLADFSMNLTPTRERFRVIQFSRVYVSDPYVLVSAKPGILPPIFAIVRPFTADVWSSVAGCTLLTGVVLWVLMWAWRRVFGGRGFKLSDALMYPCSLLLEDPPYEPPSASSARVLLGWWLVACVVIGTAYRSSLVAFLTVEGKTPPINSFDDLVKRPGWRWGMKPSTGSFFAYFNSSKDPTTQLVNKGMEVDDLEGQMKKVMAGGYSFVSTKLYSRSVIASQYTDSRGYTPFYTGTREYHHPPGNSWGVRRGGPFLDYLSTKKLQLIEAGLINYWLDDVIRTNVRETRAKGKQQTIAAQDQGRVVLGSHHAGRLLPSSRHSVALCTLLLEALTEAPFAGLLKGCQETFAA
ncbi:Variant Ionotropic Glutamate Receptor [Penaeus vannamei]|uniref:Variant Ionotropic Glutamate Receptor n=1 Tax=Penaeus vannamei TaxID=6689 RepID=A0A423U3P2_PENVA|nr:Variant Ionotropic Glutamate Receptor [Penaeus vannamei]